jgi:hypothetical protein
MKLLYKKQGCYAENAKNDVLNCASKCLQIK